MSNIDTNVLQEELEQFKKEKEHIREIVGRIGGQGTQRRDKIINIIFILLIVSLFILDMCHQIFGLKIALPPTISLELGILFVSIKIIWMIHKQEKVAHFQFWILNSIEFRLNNMSKEFRKFKKKIEN